MGHTVWIRANSLFTFASTSLALVAIMASITDYFHVAKPDLLIHVKQIERFRKQGANDEAQFLLQFRADMREVFSWNTKQVLVSIDCEYKSSLNEHNVISIWDGILQTKEEAIFSFANLRNKYRFIDQGNNLRGAMVNFTVRWEVMPVAGRLHGDKRTVETLKMPAAYIE
jgi:signal peptidase complex subunit 3